MDRPEFMRVPTKHIPEATMKKYALVQNVTNGTIFTQTNGTCLYPHFDC
jgi:hypothetical protein